MLVLLVFIGLGVAVVASFVLTNRRSDQAQDSRAASAQSLGLSPRDNESWTGRVEGAEVTLYDSLSYTRRDLDLFSFDPQGGTDHQRQLSRLTAVAVLVESAPPALAFGSKTPLTSDVHKLGDSDFDRIFAVRAADPETLSFLDARRRALLLEFPVLWFTQRRLVARVGDDDSAKQTANVLKLVALGKALDTPF